MEEPGTPRRFARCPRIAVTTPAGALEALVAERFAPRLLGLMGLAALDAPPALLFPRCGSIHSFWMRFEIDVCFLATPGRAVGAASVISVIAPARRRRSHAPPRELRGGLRGAELSALELPAGRAAELGIEAGRELGLAPLDPAYAA